jgi:hypothetical protein
MPPCSKRGQQLPDPFLLGAEAPEIGLKPTAAEIAPSGPTSDLQGRSAGERYRNPQAGETAIGRSPSPKSNPPGPEGWIILRPGGGFLSVSRADHREGRASEAYSACSAAVPMGIRISRYDDRHRTGNQSRVDPSSAFSIPSRQRLGSKPAARRLARYFWAAMGAHAREPLGLGSWTLAAPARVRNPRLSS